MDWITGGVRWDAGRLRVHPTGIPYGIRTYNLCTRKDNEAIAVRLFTWRPGHPSEACGETLEVAQKALPERRKHAGWRRTEF